MIKRQFLGVVKPRLYYNVVPDEVEELPVPKKVTLLLKNGRKAGVADAVKVGDSVKTGQRLGEMPLIKAIEDYNEVDCKVMMEIVSYLRRRH